MKITVKAVSIITAAVMSICALPVMSANAAAYTEPETTQQTENTAEFAVLMWKENKDGTLTITGCIPYISPYTKDYPSENIMSVFVFNGILPIPSEIGGKKVSSIKGVNMGKNLHLRYVKVNENVGEISENAFSDDVYIITTDKEFKAAYYKG